MSVRTASVLVIILAIVTARGAASQSAAAAEMPALRHADAEGLARLPFIVAQQKDFFAQAGVHVDVIKDAIAGPDSNSQAALKGYEPSIERGGRADMATANGGFFINAVLNGSDAVAVGVQTANPVYSLIARPGDQNLCRPQGQDDHPDRVVGWYHADDPCASGPTWHREKRFHV